MISDASTRRPVLDEPPSGDGRPETGATLVAPVFADPSGRRRRLARRAGMVTGALLVLFLGALGAGVATGADVPLTRWDAPSHHPSADANTAPKRPAKARHRTGDRVRKPGRGPVAVPPRVAGPAPSTPVPTRPKPAASTPAPVPSVTATVDHPESTPTPTLPPDRGHTKKPR
ncbi:hypothetical protein [Actinomadura litoris]|uniref:hypothetical protein n=1 Tax=Actinomadura litoris TaxID=2678616 RepID=UPI001FA7B89C|nr:hypothetical protein [Actinomadura litoris]